MDLNTFEKIGSEMFGGNRWGSKMAEAIGVSNSLVSKIRKSGFEISPKVADKVNTAYSRYKGNTADATSLADTRVGGEAAFALTLVARDLLSNKFVKVQDVNPALFFPAFAPQGQPISVNPVQQSQQAPAQDDDEALSNDEILARIDKRVRVMDRIAAGVIAGEVPSMIVFGGPGVGKSYTIMKALKDEADQNPGFHYDVIKGSVRAPGLYKALFNARNGGVVVLDDSDSVFQDEDALNLLKAALDSSETRLISWRKESAWLKDLADENGVSMEEVRNFDFFGGVVFITNLDLKGRVDAGHRMAEHYGALISRSFYVDLTIDTPRAKALRVRRVFLDGGMAAAMGLDEEQALEIADFIQENRFRLSEVSLRMASLVVKVYKSDPEDWKEIIEVTKMS